MRMALIVLAAALACGSHAGAQSQAENPRDAHGRPILPAEPGRGPALAETPDREAAPRREARQEALRKDLEEWRDRVELWRRDHEAYGGRDEAAKLNEALQRAEQAWRRLAQSTGPEWDKALADVEQARERLERRWDEANG